MPDGALIPASSRLATYETARRAVATCARIDEAADIRDKADALAAYARQKDDPELSAWLGEIKCRASIRIGELSRELERAQGAGGGGDAGISIGPCSRDRACHPPAKSETLNTGTLRRSRVAHP